jgi:hypothetical protein
MGHSNPTHAGSPNDTTVDLPFSGPRRGVGPRGQHVSEGLVASAAGPASTG